ncbi:hypothetical protein ACWEVD_08300 [Nocardia thailandica]|uniref:Uncharacterized protein n=1 Tax=Nocardia thailandica TaxID=257275 RepID=A0ABW6PSE3_9NOCA|nr:hypothetical protein [Nocardia thailandica]
MVDGACTEPGGSVPIAARLRRVEARAGNRGLAVRRAPAPPYGWELYSPARVVCRGTLDNVEDWLTAAEQQAAAGEQ